MTCVWTRNLHGWRANRSNKHSQKQFLHPDCWIQIAKSREHIKHIWFVVRLMIDPVAASLNRLIDLLWKTIATPNSTTRACAQLDSQLQNNSTFCLWRSMCRRYMTTDQRTCITSFHPPVWIHQAAFGPLHTNTFGYQYKPRKLCT